MTSSLRNLRLLTGDECGHVRTSLESLRGQWLQRNPAVPFYTLGAASYLDAVGGRFDAYSDKASVDNVLLWRHFGWLFERLASALEQEMGVPFEYDPRLALPGFHIFLFDPSFRKPLGKVHFDLHTREIRWPNDVEVDPSRPLSVTLAIALPACGGGIRMWPRLWNGGWNPYADSSEETIEYGAFQSFRYELGCYIVHSGHQLHQIAPEPDLDDNDVRITLQAHATLVNERYVLYW